MLSKTILSFPQFRMHFRLSNLLQLSFSLCFWPFSFMVFNFEQKRAFSLLSWKLCSLTPNKPLFVLHFRWLVLWRMKLRQTLHRFIASKISVHLYIFVLFLILLLIYSTCTSVIRHIPLESIDPSLELDFTAETKVLRYMVLTSQAISCCVILCGPLLLELTTEPKKNKPFHC